MEALQAWRPALALRPGSPDEPQFTGRSHFARRSSFARRPDCARRPGFAVNSIGAVPAALALQALQALQASLAAFARRPAFPWQAGLAAFAVANFEELAVYRGKLFDCAGLDFGDCRAGLGGDELAVAIPLPLVPGDYFAEGLVECVTQTVVGLGLRHR